MKKWNRIVALITVLMLCAAVIVGCNKKNSQTNGAGSSNDQNMADEENVFVTYSDIDMDKVEQMCDKIKAMNKFKNVYLAKAGGVISSHCGPGAFAIMYMTK